MPCEEEEEVDFLASIFESAQVFDVVGDAVEKLMRRVQAEITIKELFNYEITPYTLDSAFRQINHQIQHESISHDRGEYFIQQNCKQNHDWEEEDEFDPPEIDTLAAGILAVNRRAIPKKMGETVLQLPNTLRVPSQSTVVQRIRSSGESERDFDDYSSVKSATNKRRAGRHQRNISKKSQKSDRFPQIPLQNPIEEIDTPEVEAYRRTKQKEFERREEERKKELMLKKMQEMNKRELNQQAAELAKKNFSYDINGNIIFLKNIHPDSLPKDTNYELKFNLKKPPTSIKPSFLLNMPPPLKIGKEGGSKRSKISVNVKNAENLDVPTTIGENDRSKFDGSVASKAREQKRNLSLDHYAQLKQGKNLKQNYQHIKHKTKEIFPMGSNFDRMNPDLGIMVSEKGKQKRGNLNFSTFFGKFSLNEYQSKFSKTSLNFQTFDEKNNSAQRNSQRGQNTLAIDQYSISKINRGNSTKGDIENQEGNTLQLTYQTGGDMTMNLNQLTTIQAVPQPRDKIKMKNSTQFNSDILLSPQISNNKLDPFSHQQSSQDLLNSTQKSFLPHFNREQTKSQPTLHQDFQRNNMSQGKQSTKPISELPTIKSQLEEMNQRIFYNGGQAPMGDGKRAFRKQPKKPKNRQSINSILLAAKQSNIASMSQTMYQGLGDANKTSQQFTKTRQRPYIEKINPSNKNHLPPPPIGKSLGHGISS